MNKNSNYGLYAVAAAILLVGAVAFGAPLASLAGFGLILVCPLMMFFMMRGMSGGHDTSGDRPVDRPADRDHRGTLR